MPAWCKFTITSDFLDLKEADINKILTGLPNNPGWSDLQIYPDAEPAEGGHWQFPRLSAAWERNGNGYVVQCFEDVESRSFFAATSTVMSQPSIELNLGGLSLEQWPAELFVPYETAMQAIRHFLDHGLQDPALHWIGLNTFPRKIIAGRRMRGTNRLLPSEGP